MRIVVNTKDFQSQLRKVMLATSGKNIEDMPQLSCVLLSVDDFGTLSMRSYNMVTSIELSMDTYQSNKGILCVPSKLLSDVVFKCKSKELEFLSEGNSTCSINSGKIKFNIKCVDPDMFPENKNYRTANMIKTNIFSLINAASGVAYAVSTINSRPAMQGVCFDFGNGVVNIVGCDGFRLAKKTIASNSNDSFRIIVPIESISIINKIISDSEESDETEVYYSNDFITINVGKIKVTSRLISGEYLDWEKIVKIDAVSDCVFDKNELLYSIEMAMVFIEKDRKKSQPITLDFNHDNVTISARCENGDFRNDIHIENEGCATFPIAFNARYLLEAIKAVNTERVCIQVIDSLKPSIIKDYDPESKNTDVNILLPVRTRYTVGNKI